MTREPLWLVIVAHVLAILRDLLIIVVVAAVVVFGARIGRALSDLGTTGTDPMPAVTECVGEEPCW